MAGFVSAHIPWNALSNLELRWSYGVLRSKLVLPPATTLGVIWWREYALTVDAIKEQLQSGTEVSLALDGWILRNTLPIPSVIAYWMDRHWTFCEVHLAFDVIEYFSYSRFESKFRMIGHRQPYWGKASRALEGRS